MKALVKDTQRRIFFSAFTAAFEISLMVATWIVVPQLSLKMCLANAMQLEVTVILVTSQPELFFSFSSSEFSP